jgi:RNA polymerase sigma-70 factor (ECF subfamily)
VRAGDAVALETLFRRYYASLVRFAASYVGSFDHGEELVADVFAWLWEHRATWTTTSSVSAYLFGAVRHRALDVKRHQAREHHRMTMFRAVGEMPGSAAPSLGVAEQIERDEYTTVLLRLIAKLSERRRLILSLRWNHAMPWEAIAAVLGATSGAVRSEYSRTLASLRAALEGL